MKKAALFIVILTVLLGITTSPVSSFVLPANSEDSNLHAQNSLQISDLLFEGLDWTKPGWPLAINFITDGNAETVSTPGTAFLSSSFQGKPSSGLFAFYYLDRMRDLGWHYVRFLNNDYLMEIQYYHPEMERGADVRIGRCSLMRETDALPDHFCVQVWVSSGPVTPTPKTQSLWEVQISSKLNTAEPGPDYQNPLPVPFYSQRVSDPTGSITLGYGKCSFTLYDLGCTVAAYAMIYDYYQAGSINPIQLNESLKVSPGVFSLYQSDCYIYWPDYLDLPDAPSGVYGSPRVYNACQDPNCLDESNLTLIDSELKLGHPIHARVHWQGEDENHHSVVIIGHVGSDIYILDPLALDDSPRTLSTGVEGEYIVDYLFFTHGKPHSDAISSGGVLPSKWGVRLSLLKSSYKINRFLQ